MVCSLLPGVITVTAVLHNTAVPASAPLGVRKEEEEGEPRCTIYALKLVCTVCNNLTTTLFFVCTNTKWFSYLQNLLYLFSAFIEYCFNYLKKKYYTLHLHYNLRNNTVFVSRNVGFFRRECSCLNFKMWFVKITSIWKFASMFLDMWALGLQQAFSAHEAAWEHLTSAKSSGFYHWLWCLCSGYTWDIICLGKSSRQSLVSIYFFCFRAFSEFLLRAIS